MRTHPLARSRVATLALALALGAGAPCAVADVINVPADQPTIQAGVNAATTGDEVVVAPGTYNERIDLDGKAITLRSSDGAASTTIDGGGVGPVVRCDSSETSATILQGFTVRNGSAINGAGLLISGGASPTVLDCVFRDNTATGSPASQGGGGIGVINAGSPRIERCVMAHNTAGLGGGILAITNNASPTLINCLIYDNHAVFGGGVASEVTASVTMHNCTVGANTASSIAPGVCTFQAATSMTNCVASGHSVDVVNLNGASTTVRFSLVSSGSSGQGNITAPASFVAPTAPAWDFHLATGSLAIDAGANALLPAGVATDLDANPRFTDDPDKIDSGLGAAPIIDMGAYERVVAPPPCPADWNQDGFLNDQDFFDWANDYFTGTGPRGQHDFNNDGFQNDQDFFEFANAFFTPGPGC